MIATADEALRGADQCVRCGLCLPHCPTYRLRGDEGDGPRGRVALAEALLRGQLEADAALRRHLEGCTLCGACERACPSGVPFSRIMDQARARLGPPRGLGLLTRATGPGTSRLGALLPGWPGRLSRALDGGVPPRPGTYAPTRDGGEGRRLGLLLGCATRERQGGALHAALALLRALGHTVVVPAEQGCCGALASHHGAPALGERQAGRNAAAFAGLDGLVGIASGCVAHLRGRDDLPPVEDVVSLLARTLPRSGLRFRPLRERIAVQTPCSQQEKDATAALLSCLPGLETVPLPATCCGAGGLHLLLHREQAVALRAPLLEAVRASGVRLLASANTGCALHLAEGAAAAGLELEVVHPVELLARRLEPATAQDGSATMGA